MPSISSPARSGYRAYPRRVVGFGPAGATRRRLRRTPVTAVTAAAR
ncbi:hypothetical protein ACFC1B_07675 [Streptomyces xiamenensis]